MSTRQLCALGGFIWVGIGIADDMNGPLCVTGLGLIVYAVWIRHREDRA